MSKNTSSRSSQAEKPTQVPSNLGANDPNKGPNIKAKHIKPFGVFVITRSRMREQQFGHFKVYACNPGIVNEWLGTTFVPATSSDQVPVTCSTWGAQEIDNVNDFRIRTGAIHHNYFSNGACENWWIESGSGNEFRVSTDLPWS